MQLQITKHEVNDRPETQRGIISSSDRIYVFGPKFCMLMVS